jgi:ABC-type antimicrobial peptide transport system permease subunit
MGAFGGLASGLAVLGFYGLLAHLVRLRTREIGIRIAMGAAPSTVLGRVLRSGLAHAVGGIALGVVLTIASWRIVGSRVPGVGHMEAPVLAVLAGAVIVVAAIATWLPSRRATRVDPVVALRADG